VEAFYGSFAMLIDFKFLTALLFLNQKVSLKLNLKIQKFEIR
jgi:hypothetical protein